MQSDVKMIPQLGMSAVFYVAEDLLCTVFLF